MLVIKITLKGAPMFLLALELIMSYYHFKKNSPNVFENFTKQKLKIGDKTLP
jgi:hypothetical protein